MSATNGATWRNGYAPLCKSVYPGSIPGVASINHFIHLGKQLRLTCCSPRSAGPCGALRSLGEG